MATRMIDTGLKTVWSAKGDTDSANFVPVTGPINSTMVKNVRVSKYIESNTGKCEVRHGYNMSDDGITWSSTVTELGDWSTTTGWSSQTLGATPVTANQKLFVRFGLLGANQSGADVERATARLRIDPEPTSGETKTTGPTPVWSDGTTTTGIFHPLTGALPIEAAIQEIRGTLEVGADSGACIVQPAWQVSDDRLTWSDGAAVVVADSATTFGTAQTGDGITYGTTFEDFSPNKGRPWVRFGVVCKNSSGSNAEACLAALRVDYRKGLVGGRRKVLDLDFTAEPTQDLSGGGSFTIGGVVFKTFEEGNASTFEVTNGTGLRIFNNTTATIWRSTGFGSTAPALWIDNIFQTLGIDWETIRNVQFRLSLDTSSASAATELAGFGVEEQTSGTACNSVGIGHDGTNPILRGQRQLAFTDVTVTATEAGSGAVLGMDYCPNSCVLYNGDGVDVAPSFADMTRRGVQSGGQLPFGGNRLWQHTDLYLWSAENNTAGTLETVFTRLEIWVVEAALP